MSEVVGLRPPEEVFNGDNLPEDLKWIMTHFSLPKNDPTVVLLSWHWYRVLNNQDAIHAGCLELKTVLDPRLNQVKAYSEALGQLQRRLDQLASFFHQRDLKDVIHAGLDQPLSNLKNELATVVPELKKSWSSLFWAWAGAIYLGGLTSGIVITLCVFYYLSSR